MPAIVYKKFAGEIPNAEPHLLPDDRAQFAQNCEFTDGSLTPMKDGLLLRGMSNSPVRSIYTEDGITFYTWSTETSAFRSPVIDEVYNRVYIHTAGQPLKVTTTLQMTAFGPSPTAGNTWNAGVPKPTAAPTLTKRKRTTLKDYPSAAISFSAWYEYSGKEYDRVESASAAAVTPWQKYTVTKPSRTNSGEDGDGNATGTPDGAKLVILVKITDGTKTLVSSRVSIDSVSSSAALPGGLEIVVSGASTSPTVEVAINWGTVETRAYTYTWTNTWEEQGAPSAPATIDVTYLDDIIVATQDPSTLFIGYRPYLKTRVYRTFGTGTAYLEATVAPESAAYTYSEQFGGSTAATALSSQDYAVPPVSFDSVAIMPNGWIAGARGNTLYMSEPYRPHAWPYSMTFSKNIRGIHVGQQSLVVTTADGVHVVSGSFPASAQSIRLSAPQAGLTPRSMTAVDGSVAYASNDGLVFVSGTEASLAVSQKLFSRKKWRDLYGSDLSTMSLGYHDGCLIGTSSAGGKGFNIRLDEDAGAFSRVNVGYDAMFFLPVNDALYYSIGSGVYQFKVGGNMSLDWWGKDWIFPQGATFGAGFLRANGAITLTLYADGEQVFSQVLASGYFRLPSMKWATRWSIRISGTSEVFELAIAQSMGELKSV